MTDRELMQQALDALEWCYDVTEWPANGKSAQDKAIEALRARLAQPEHGDGYRWREGDVPPSMTYTAPPQREWQGLTDEEIKHLWYEACQTNLELTSQLIVHLARNIEAKLKAKNA